MSRALVDTPRGLEGRSSQSLTLAEASALLEAAEASRLHGFIVLCLLTGVRPEEVRALTWEHVDLDAGTISVWRSVWAHGDTKTNRSRRTLKLAEIAVEALRAQGRRQAAERAEAGELWQEHRLVFTTSVGTGYESHNLRRDFRRVTAAAGLGARWVPKELRTQCHLAKVDLGSRAVLAGVVCLRVGGLVGMIGVCDTGWDSGWRPSDRPDLAGRAGIRGAPGCGR
jgi:integrase